MPDRRFKLGDIVRCNEAGKRETASGHIEDKLVVMDICEGHSMAGEPLIRVRPFHSGNDWYGGRWRERWRERWYDLVDTEGPW